MKCLDCDNEVDYEWPRDPEKRAAMQERYQGVVCDGCSKYNMGADIHLRMTKEFLEKVKSGEEAIPKPFPYIKPK
jgi:hypothetical protein